MPPDFQCSKCGRTFSKRLNLTLHSPNCARLPPRAQCLAEYDAENCHAMARRYGINPNWLEEHLLALRSPERGDICQRCGIGSGYGGALDARGWCGWCQEETAATPNPAARVIGRIRPDSAELEAIP